MVNKKQILVVCFALFVVLSVALGYALTFSNSFSDGTFQNTTYNGTAVVLSGENLSGIFTSKVFDAVNNSLWINISAGYSAPRVDFIFAIDNNAGVWRSYNGSSWTLVKSDYNNGDGNGVSGTAFDSRGNYFAVYKQNVWRSNDSGNNWTRINNNYNGAESNNAISFAIDRDDSLYIIEGDEDVWKSTDSGVSWNKIATNFNGASGNVLGFVVNSSNGMIGVDVVSDVWQSNDSGNNWTKINDDYNNGAANGLDGMTIDSSNNLYILDNQDVWKSTDSGSTWNKVNEDFNGAGDSNSGTAITIDSNNNLYVVDGSEDVFYSSNGGVDFIGINSNFNGANGGVGVLSVGKLNSNVTFQARNCSSSDCSGGIWQNVNLNNINLTGRYFQYRVNMTRDAIEILPAINSATINYANLVYTAYVDDDFSASTNGWGITHFKNISSALSVVESGGRINVAPGIYNEKITISKTVELNGSGFDNTNINGTKSGNTISVNANYVNISGFKITGSGINWGESGIYLNAAGYATIRNNYILGNRVGISVIGAPNNRIYSNYIVNSTEYGVYSNNWGSSGNYYYDNYFSNSANFYAATQNPANYFNISKTTRTNILGGQYTGGNFWSSYSGTNRGDGFGSTSYNLFGIYYDYLPLIGSTAPEVNITSPEENNIYKQPVFLNFTATDIDGDLGSCWYNIDSNTNITLPSCSTASISGLSDGSHSLTIYANDSAGNLNSDSVNFYFDGTSPSWSNVVTGNLASYSQNLSYFNISWTDSNGIGKVLFESNFSGTARNYSMTSLGGGVYGFNAELPAGTFYWKSYANDSLGNVNQSNEVIFSIEKSTEGLRLYINGSRDNMNTIYGSQTNASALAIDGNVLLYRNGELVSNPDIVILAAGAYNYSAVFSGNENYSSGMESYILNISKATPSLRLLLNGLDSDLSINADSEFEVNASIVVPSEERVVLYEDNTQRDSGNNISVIESYSTLGEREWKVSYSGNENYSALNYSHSVSVLDSNSPQFSNLKAGTASPTTYSSSRSYLFNSTWTDNIGVEDVILEFNQVNYSYLNGDVLKNGNEYYINIGNLGAGSYSYKWYGKDSTGNLVGTPVQSYLINPGVAALFLTISPGSTISYGTSMSVSCSANNPESVLVLTRNSGAVSNPDSSSLAVGSYNYACTSSATQNYSSASATGSLTVNKAVPGIRLYLNGVEGDLNLGTSGGSVNITAIGIANESVNLTISGEFVGSGESVENTSLFSSVGTYPITVSFGGNQNYSSRSLTRNVIVSAPSTSSGGGGGGGGGGSSSSSVKFTGTTGIEIKEISEVIGNAGDKKRISVGVKNTGTNFLNGCTLKGIGDYSSWISSEETKKLGGGEASEFAVALNIPEKSQSGNYMLSFEIQCDELQKSSSFNVQILEKKLELNIIKTERDSQNNLKIIYLLKEMSGIDQNVEVQFVLMSGNQRITDFNENVQISANENKQVEALIPIGQGLEGNFNLLININSEKYSSFQEENILLSKGVSGFSIFASGNDGAKTFTWGALILFVVFAGFMVYRILRLRREVKKHRKLSRAVKIRTSKDR